MKKIIYILLVGVLFAQCTPKVAPVMTKTDATTQVNEDFRAHQPQPGPAPTIKLGKYQEFTLDNGVKCIVVENNKVPKVSFRLFIDEQPSREGKKAGAAEFAGDLLSRGSKNRTKAQLDEEVDFIGADFSTFSQGFYAASLSKYTDQLMDVVSDAIFNPTFSEEQFNKIKKQKLSSLASEKEDPNAIAGNVRGVLNFGKNHPYGEVVTEETVNNLTVQDCKNYYQSHFRPNNAFLIFVGDIKLEDAKKMANKYFGKWKPVILEEMDEPKVTIPTKRTVDFVHKSGAVQSVVNVTYPVDFKPDSPDAIKASVMNTLLGGFFRSRLNQNLREDHAYTYGAGSALRKDRLIGSFRAGGSVRNEVTDSVIVQIDYELNRLINEKVSEEELDLVKNVMAGQFGRSLEDPRTMARFSLNVARYNLPKNYYRDYLKNLAAVTAEDVQMMAKKYLKPNACHILVVGDKNEVADKLTQFGTVNFYDTYGNPVTNEGPAVETLSLLQLMDKHSDAMGGKKAMDDMKSLVTEYTAEVQGTKLNLWSVKVDGEKYAMKASIGGQPMQEQRFMDGKGVNMAQGQ
ncbi:MAG TPA: insulinase family protein, partial [Saprospiraceae bacterium]|nr:insulinase family protein [Saprospiraceae bacterium]